MQRTYKGIFFDLDGTLLNIDMDLFLEQYFKGIGAFAARHGFDAHLFTKALIAGVESMTDDADNTAGAEASMQVSEVAVQTGAQADAQGTQTGAQGVQGTQGAQPITNGDRFWRTFSALTGKPRAEVEPVLLEYYQTDFNDIGKTIEPRYEALEIVQVLRAKRYPLYLTTMPLFPLVAVEQRLKWAGLNPQFFERITTYDNSHSTKPHRAYYQENVDAIGLAPENILMVGNNTREDLASMVLGIDGYLVTDCLLNPDDFDINQVKHGSLADFLAFVQAMPVCSSEACPAETCPTDARSAGEAAKAGTGASAAVAGIGVVSSSGETGAAAITSAASSYQGE